MMPQHTPGPWAWFSDNKRPYLATPDRGRLYVMGFARSGMQGAAPLFSRWDGIQSGTPRERRGGIMEAGILLPDGRMHPDARMIEAAPRLFAVLRALHANMAAQDLEDQSARPTEQSHQQCMRDAAATIAEFEVMP